MDPEVPLVVPEVNPEAIPLQKQGHHRQPELLDDTGGRGIKALADAYGLKRVVYSTYQAVSGAGQKGYQDLVDGLAGKPPQKFPHPIAGNCLPHIDSFLDNGYTKEEMKMVNETRKISRCRTLPSPRRPCAYRYSTATARASTRRLLRPFDIAEARCSRTRLELSSWTTYKTTNTRSRARRGHRPRLRRPHPPRLLRRKRRQPLVRRGQYQKGRGHNAVQIAEELIRQWEA